MVPRELEKLLLRQKYKIIGRSAAAKLCLWTKRAILGKGACYKQQFYGVPSHRCLQITPCVAHCTHKCVFCWRAVDFTETEMRTEEIDEPRDIVARALVAQREMISGFGGVEVDEEKYREAQEPKNVAISLSGEPTLYPKLNALINEFRSQNMSTFVVSNGTQPEVIGRITPTQLYVSLCAPDEKTYKNVNAPLLSNGWARLNRSLSLLARHPSRTVIRMTLVRDVNMHAPEKYAELVRLARPVFVECKSYMHVGYSIHRLGVENMPSFGEIKDFARDVAREAGYVYTDENEVSRVALLCRDEESREKRFL
ncbi:MAG: 4-demethylwyosine synthase TYW1 [Candidatus Micrarchaeota archaeon]